METRLRGQQLVAYLGSRCRGQGIKPNNWQRMISELLYITGGKGIDYREIERVENLRKGE